MQKYTCPMHPEVITDHPGNCPKCGMKLVPIKEKKRRTPINREQASNSDKSRAGVQRSTSKVGAMDPNRPGHEHPPSQDYGAASEQDKTQKYTCMMHPEVVMDHPGKCPKCGMKLVPVSGKKRSTSNAQRPTLNRCQWAEMSHPSHEMHAPSHEGHEMQMEMSMHSTIDLADPMSREGSGTSWIPDSSPMYGRMFMFGENMLMLHGAIFPRYTNVSTRRGDDRIDAPNWFMAMFSHPLGESTQFGSRLMMSLDPLTERAAVIRFCFKPAKRGTERHCTTANIRTISSTNFRSASRRNSSTISARTSISVIRVSRRSVRQHSCIARRQWTIQTHRSDITGRTPRTSRLALRRSGRSGAT